MFSESDGYERFMGRWSRRLAPLFVTFAGVTEGDRVLDVGSGTGALAVTAAAIESVQVTGIERSPAYVRYAEGDAEADGVRFEVGDALSLPFSDDAFDRTLSMLVLNFVPDPAAALQQMIRVTRPGGVVAAAVWTTATKCRCCGRLGRCLTVIRTRRRTTNGICRSSTRGALADLWRTHGLRDIDEQPLIIDMAFGSFDDYWQPFLCGQGPAGVYVSSLSASARHVLESTLRERLGDTGLGLPARAWAVRGVVT